VALKDILVHLDGSARSAARLALALELAARNEAHLTGLFALNLPVPNLYVSNTAYDFRAFSQIMDQMRAEGREAALKLEESFREEVSRKGVTAEWRLIEEQDAVQALVGHARYADLVIVGQADPDDPPPHNMPHMAEAAILGTGRPVLVVPYVGDFDRLGRNILVGWKSGREAARAVNDAMPLLLAADSVTILAIDPAHGISGEGDVPALDLTGHLGRHGVKAIAAHTIAAGVSEGDVLLNYASDNGADLIVCGAYGHSRTREFVFGGVTRSLLVEMTVPVLFSH
jgi:nucleotide-binding universal stress UspA family protein